MAGRAGKRGRRPASPRAARAGSASRRPRAARRPRSTCPSRFGPTTTATPGSRRTSTASGNDLKPRQLDRSQVHARAGGYGARADAARAPAQITRPGPFPGSAHATSSPTRSGWSLWTCCSTFETSSSSLSPRNGLAARAIDFLGHRSSSSRSPGSYVAAIRSSACLAAGLPRRPSSSGLCRYRPRHRRSPRHTGTCGSCGGPWDVEHVCRRPAGPGGRAPPGARSCGRRGVVSA